jgi:1-acyl-sn-glycerol-3-phosphate acyltransferase
VTAKPPDKDKDPVAPDSDAAADAGRSSRPKRAPAKRRRDAQASGGEPQGKEEATPPKKPAKKKARTRRTPRKRAAAKTRSDSEQRTASRRTAKNKTTGDKREQTAAPGDKPDKPEQTPEASSPEAAERPARSGRRARYEDAEDPHALGIGSRIVPPVMAYGEDVAPPSEPPGPADTGNFELTQQEVEAQIRALEARLDGMIRRAGGPRDDESEPPPSIREQVGSAARAVVDRLSAPLPLERPGSDDGGVVDAVRELSSSDYYIRQWGRIGMRNRSEEVDDFGLDPTYEKRLRPLFDFLYKRYFRSETRGVESIPAEGRCLVVANHSGTVPFDGMMLRTAVRLEHPAARELRWLTEDFIYYLPFMGAFMNRIGAVRACQENAERLLKQGRLVGVFPEGIKGVGKLYRDRYRLQRFGRGGYIRLCLRTQTPLVPCAILGAEETNPMLYRVEYLSRAFGLPYIPVTPTFPWLGPLGLLPAPTKWRIRFGEPIRFDEYGPEAADDHVLVGRLSEQVRTTIQRMLDNALRERQSVWFG